jgi:hypothetical protein
MNTIKENKEPQLTEEIGPKPDESGGFYFSSFLRITDPNTKEVLVETRGDI